MSSSRTDDLVAIRDVIDRYSIAATRRDAAAISALFMPDGVWQVPPPVGMEYRGADVIGSSIVASLGGFSFLVQMAHSVAIDLDGDSATARTVIEEIGALVEPKGPFRMLGIYDDVLVRTDAGWRFSLRRFDTIDVETGASLEDMVAAAPKG